MGWVTPTTWAAQTFVTRDQFNDWNKSMAAVGDHTAWTTWAPALRVEMDGGDGGPLSMDGSTKAGRKLQVGKLMYASFHIDWGSAGLNKTGVGANEYRRRIRLNLPAAAASSGWVCGYAYLYGGGPDDTYLMVPLLHTTTCCWLYLTWDGSSNSMVVWTAPNEYDAGGTPDWAEFGYASGHAAGTLIYRSA